MREVALLLALCGVLRSEAASSPPALQPAVAEGIPPGAPIGGWVTSGAPIRSDAVGAAGIRIPISAPFLPCTDKSWRLLLDYYAVGVDLEEGFGRFSRETDAKSASSGDVIAWVYANTPHALELFSVSVESEDASALQAAWKLDFRVESFFGRLPPVYPPPKGWRRSGCESGHCQKNRRFWPDRITAEVVPSAIADWLNDELPCDLPSQRPAADILAAIVATQALAVVTGSPPSISRVALVVHSTEYSSATHRSSYFWAIAASSSPTHHWLIRVDPCTLSLISIEPRRPD